MIRAALYHLTAKLPARLICVDDQPYLERYYVGRLFGVTFYLHRFVAADQDRHVHDHPWPWALSLILAGSYVEETVRWFTPECGWVSRFTRRCWWRPNRLSARSFHRIHTAEPDTWTLFMHGRRCKRWGFLEPMHQGVLRGAVYQQHLNDTATIGWEQTAPPGSQIGRVPFPVPAAPHTPATAFHPVAEAGYLSGDD